jgi:hypothetical protein
MILPGNAADDVIPVTYTNTAPAPLVVKKPPVILQQNVVVPQDTLKDRYEDAKEIDARNFPVLRGFV